MDTKTTMQGGNTTFDLVHRLCMWAGLIAGAWLIVAPQSFAMDFADDSNALWSTTIAGAVVAVSGIVLLLRMASNLVGYAVLGLAGLWAILAPYVIDFVGGTGGDAAMTSIVTGIVIVAVAAVGYAASLQSDN